MTTDTEDNKALAAQAKERGNALYNEGKLDEDKPAGVSSMEFTLDQVKIYEY